MKQGFEGSDERISGLYKLDAARAVELFKQALKKPKETSPFAASREEIESNRIFLLRCVYSIERNPLYSKAIAALAASEVKNVRALFATSVPSRQVAPEVLTALKL